MRTHTEVLTASSAKTATGNVDGIQAPPGADYISVEVAISAVSGTTPSMSLTLQWSHDGVTYAGSDTFDFFNAMTTAITRVKRFDVKGPLYRLTWVITGTTPSFTFAATSFAVV